MFPIMMVGRLTEIDHKDEVEITNLINIAQYISIPTIAIESVSSFGVKHVSVVLFVTTVTIVRLNIVKKKL